MKYKVLINQGNSMSVVKDFFTDTKKYFTSYTTTDIWEDELNHFEAIKPDVYLIFMDSAFSESITQLPRLKTNSNFNNRQERGLRGFRGELSPACRSRYPQTDLVG